MISPILSEQQSPEVSEIRVIWEQHHTKTDIRAPVARIAPAPARAAQVPRRVAEGAAAHTALHRIGRLLVFPTVVKNVGIPEIRLSPAFSPQTSRPFPHIPRHIETSEYGFPFRKTTHRTGG